MHESYLKAQCEKERLMLREELHRLKSCQITFLTAAASGTGLLLGLAEFRPNETPGPLYLLPLTILLPFWWAFFDKATTITRLVGYYRILERCVVGGVTEIEFLGWERALREFRLMQARGEFEEFDTTRLGEAWRFITALTLKQGHRYLALAHATFGGLSTVCIVASLSRVPSDQPWAVPTILVATLAVLYSFVCIWIMAFHLVWGRLSFNVSQSCWEKVLRIPPEPPRRREQAAS